MKNSFNTAQKATLALSALGLVSAAQASTDYGPAIWRPICEANYYTSGYGHKFHVIHDIEGYYWSTIAWFDNCGMTSASIHYITNGKTDNSSDAAPGEISQLGVRDAQYAWHARCWNQHSTGTEHEGFASNPAWFTDAQYQSSAGATRNLATKFGWAKDRNHIVAHGQETVSGWPAYASANLGIDPYCNTHHDPGAYWDWTKYMGMVNPATKTAVTKDNTTAAYTGSWATGTSSTDKYGSDYRYHSTAAVSEPATFTASLNVSATWNVRAWWPQGSNRSASAPYIVSHSGGTTTVNKNQQANGGSWQLLGSWGMSGTQTVKLSCWTTTGYIVVADAVKWD